MSENQRISIGLALEKMKFRREGGSHEHGNSSWSEGQLANFVVCDFIKIYRKMQRKDIVFWWIAAKKDFVKMREETVCPTLRYYGT